MDLLIDSHCRLIRTTRCLLAWGTTLHVAVAHLDTVSVDVVTDHLARLPALGLTGGQVHFLGAPARLNDIAARIARKVCEQGPDHPGPELRQIYIVALQQILQADVEMLTLAHRAIET